MRASLETAVRVHPVNRKYKYEMDRKDFIQQIKV